MKYFTAIFKYTYCWWFRNPASRLICGGYPIIPSGCFCTIPGGCLGFDFFQPSTLSRLSTYLTKWPHPTIQISSPPKISQTQPRHPSASTHFFCEVSLLGGWHEAREVLQREGLVVLRNLLPQKLLETARLRPGWVEKGWMQKSRKMDSSWWMLPYISRLWMQRCSG